jgi:transposase InsO family protein
MCQLTKVSHAGYYRFLGGASAEPEGIELRHQIQQIALQWPAYGSRRTAAELRRRGWPVNRKRVQRLMREDNLLCLRKRRFVVTTNSEHAMPVYPNRAASMTLSGCDQLWLADITYIRLLHEFVYLAVILDAYSRRVIGWALERTLEERLSLAALQMALSQRQVRHGLVHHSDRGVQYASLDYTDALRAHGIVISMSRRGNPYDNAACESFMKTLKYEEVYRSEYQDLEDAHARIGTFLEHIYNKQRLHSALQYRPHAEFERLQPATAAVQRGA